MFSIPGHERDESEDVVNTTLSELIAFLLFAFGILFVLQQIYQLPDRAAPKNTSCLWENHNKAGSKPEERGVFFAVVHHDAIYVRGNGLENIVDQIRNIIDLEKITSIGVASIEKRIATNIVRIYKVNVENRFERLSFSECGLLMGYLHSSLKKKSDCSLYTTYSTEIDFDRRVGLADRIRKLADALADLEQASLPTTSRIVTALVRSTRRSFKDDATYNAHIIERYSTLCRTNPVRVRCKVELLAHQ